MNSVLLVTVNRKGVTRTYNCWGIVTAGRLVRLILDSERVVDLENGIEVITRVEIKQ